MTSLRRRSDFLALVLLSLGFAACDGGATLDPGGPGAGSAPPSVQTPTAQAGADGNAAAVTEHPRSTPTAQAGAGGSATVVSVQPGSAPTLDACDGDQVPLAVDPARATDPQNRCPCSRAAGRANPPSGWTCPAGTGASASATIGPAGGTLSLVTGTSGVTLELDVPAGALAETTQLTVTELPGPTPTDYTDYSPVYKLAPTNVTFKVPAHLRLPWSLALKAGVVFYGKKELSIYFASCAPDGFARLPDSYVNAGFSQASLDRLGYVFAGYPASLDPALCTAP
jgi:hypothetical protein